MAGNVKRKSSAKADRKGSAASQVLTAPTDTARRDFSARLRFLVGQYKSQSELARKAGIDQRTLSSAIKRGNAKRELCAALARATACSAKWLLFGEGEPFPEPKIIAELPVYETGGGLHWVVADELEPYTLDVPGNLICYRVRGDSMEPLARDGQIVLANPSAEIKNGDLAVVQLQNGTHTFKRVQFRDKEVTLVSVNPAYPVEFVHRRDILHAWRVWGVRFA